MGEIVIRRFLIVLLTLAILGSAAPAFAKGTNDVRSAIGAVKDGKLDDAIALLTRAISTGDLNSADLSYAYDLRGNAWDDKGEFVRAIADYDRAIKVKPDYAQAYNDRGIARNDKGDYDEAIRDYNRAIELKADFAQAYNNRGIAYHHKANELKAIAEYTRAIELNPKYAHAYYNRAISYHLRGEEAAAKKDYYEAIRLDSTLEKPH
jgi:tetratricopeptide (TPR) repeat protein